MRRKKNSNTAMCMGRVGTTTDHPKRRRAKISPGPSGLPYHSCQLGGVAHQRQFWTPRLRGGDRFGDRRNQFDLRVRDGLVVTLDPEEGIAGFEMDTGRPIALPSLPVGSDRRESRAMGMSMGVSWVPSILRQRVLYFWTKDQHLVALDVNPTAKAESRILWRIAMENPPFAFDSDGDR